jgi:hypothetical protein
VIAVSELNLKDVDNWQFHYVVVFDAETGTFSVDADTTDAVFHNGQVFMPDAQEWYAPDSTDDPRAFDLIDEIAANLNKKLES